METKQLALGDFLQEVLSKLNLAIKDEELLASLNETKLSATKGLELIYPIDKKVELPVIPKVNAQEILNEVNLKEEQFEKFWEIYNKKTGRTKAQPRFLKLSIKEIDAIFATLPYYLKFTPDIKFRKDPFTYLNQRVWEDEVYMPRKIESPQTASAFKF
jgi:hypothetical protein